MSDEVTVKELLDEARELHVENARLERHNRQLVKLYDETKQIITTLVEANELNQKTISGLIDSLGQVLDKEATKLAALEARTEVKH